MKHWLLKGISVIAIAMLLLPTVAYMETDDLVGSISEEDNSDGCVSEDVYISEVNNTAESITDDDGNVVSASVPGEVAANDASDQGQQKDGESIVDVLPEAIDAIVEEQAEVELSDESLGQTTDLQGEDDNVDHEDIIDLVDESQDATEESTIVSLDSVGIMAEASSTLQRPVDVDNGSYVDAYRYYLDNKSPHNGFAILVDFDLDGKPELLALSDQWSHSGTPCCYVKYTGNSYIVFEGTYLYDMAGSLYLILENGSYAWYKSRSYASTGLYDKSINRITFSSNMRPTETIRFGLYGDMDNGTEEYLIGSRNVSKNEYNQEEAKWNSINKLLTLDPYDFAYPSAWNSAINQYSVIIKPDSTTTNTGNTSGSGNSNSPSGSSGSTGTSSQPNTPTITFTKNAKYKVKVGTNFQILLNGATAKSFKSSKRKVASVSSSGFVTPLKPGKTKVTVKLTNRKRYTVTLNVYDPTIPTSVSLNMSGTNNVKTGDTVTLTASLPSGTNSGIKWKSNHKSVATVSNGVVTFKKKGSVTITATTTRGNKKAKVKFKVTKYDAKKDLSNYGWRTVTGVEGDNKLTFRSKHKGGYMKKHRFANGERIYVNLTWRESGDAIAYDNGTYGYVQAKYIDW